jgi:hypothetical protein
MFLPFLIQGDVPMTDRTTDLTMEIYEAFALNQLDRWDGLIRPDVKVNSPAGRDIVGIDALKAFGAAFHAAFRPRIDLIDHFVCGDRALVTSIFTGGMMARTSTVSLRLGRAAPRSSHSCCGSKTAR